MSRDRMSDAHLLEIRARWFSGAQNTSIIAHQDLGDLIEEAQRARAEVMRTRADADYIRQHIGNAVEFCVDLATKRRP